MLPAANEVGEAAVRVIAPYVPILFHKLGEGALKKAGSDAFDTAKELYQKIWTKAETDEATLSDQPITQKLLEIVKAEQNNTEK